MQSNIDLPVIEVTPAIPEDALAIAQVHVRTWQEAYAGIVAEEYLASLSIPKREAGFRESLTLGRPEVLVAKENGAVVGWVSFDKCRDDDATSETGEVWAIYVAASHWSKGVGRRLWLRTRARLVERGFAKASLWVLTENVRAIRFYRAIGFSPEPSTIKDISLGGKVLKEIRYVTELTATPSQ